MLKLQLLFCPTSVNSGSGRWIHWKQTQGGLAQLSPSAGGCSNASHCRRLSNTQPPHPGWAQAAPKELH